MNKVDKEYLRVLEDIVHNGFKKHDRTGTGTLSTFGQQLKFSFDEGFPILTTKKVGFDAIKIELLWFLGCHLKDDKYKDLGITNIKYLVDNGCNIWNEWPYKYYIEETKDTISQKEFILLIKEDALFAKKWGSIGNGAYGKQWIDWNGEINQVKNSFELLKTNPDSRRIMVNAWNPTEIESCLLPPCHFTYQFWSREMPLKERINEWTKSLGKSIHYGDDMTHDKLDLINFPKRKLSISFTMRSNDYFLGNPYNISSYSLLLSMFSHCLNMIPEFVIANLNDCHLYLNHLEQVKEQLNRQIKYKLPKLILNKNTRNIEDFTLDDICLVDYQHDTYIKAPVAV